MKKTFALFFFGIIVAKSHSQVNLQTGSASYGVQMFNWQDEKSRLTSSIAINYSSGNGLKVDEGASNIGQGWGLIAGGVITRMQVGEPDDQHAVDFYDAVSQKQIQYPNGYLFNPLSAAAGCPVSKGYYPIYKDRNTVYREKNTTAADTEQDYFSFMINGRANLFVLDKSNIHSAKVVGDSKLKISFEEGDMSGQNIRTTISSFTIEDENGLIYRFAARSTTKLLKNHYAAGSYINSAYTQVAGLPTMANFGVYHQATFDELTSSEKPFIVSSWHLTEIEDRLTHRKIYFTYDTENTDNYAGQTMSLTISNPISFLLWGQKNYINVNHHRSLSQNLVLNQIIFPDGNQAKFVYAEKERSDMKGGHALSYVMITYQGKTVTRFELLQEYYGNSIANRVPRLYLTGCKQYSSDLQDYKKHVFNYILNTGSENSDDFIPPVYFECKDSYGYYNGSASGIQTNGTLYSFDDYSLLCWFKRDASGIDYKSPKLGYAKIGLLNKVYMPSGGSMEYRYSQIQGYGGVQVSSTILRESENAANAQTTTYAYVLSNGQCSIWGNEVPDNRINMSSYYGPEGKGFGGVSCDYQYKYPGILALDEAINPSSIQQFLSVFSQITGYVGLAYDLFSIVLAVIGKGDLETAIIMFIFDILSNVITTCLDDASETDTYKVYYSVNFKMANPLPLQFKRVEVRQTFSGGDNGKTVFEFTSPDDFPAGILVSNLTYPFSFKPRTIAWAYGQPKKTTVFDVNGTPVSETENIYDFTKAKIQLTQDAFQSCKCGVKLGHSKNNVEWSSSAFGNQYITQSDANIEVDKYSIFTGRTELVETDQRIYNGNNFMKESKVFYGYSSKNYMVNKVTSIESNKDKSIKETYYPEDYTAAGVLQILTANNLVNQPVATYESIQRNNSASVGYISATITDFIQITNGDIKPYRDLIGRSNAPVSFTFDASNQFNYPGLVQHDVSSYTAAGNVDYITDEGGRTIMYLYDYLDKRPVCVISNVTPSIDKSSFSSFETDEMGGWALNSVPTYTTISSMTGNRSLVLATGDILSTPITSSNTYTLSFWADNSGIVPNISANLVKSGPSINGYTYYEYSVPDGFNSVGIQGVGKIDELRLYPSKARMKTVAYDPVLLQKISECDENNRIVYYEYDGWGRLLFVRDEQKNIVKMNEYYFKK